MARPSSLTGQSNQLRNIAGNTAHIVAVLLVIMVVLIAAVLGYARIKGLMVMSVESGSMQPLLRRGDAVLVRQGSSGLAVGDVVSYRSLSMSGVIVTHRIRSIDSRTGLITTQGDALQMPDRPFASDRIVGQVVHRIPSTGYGLDVLRRPAGLIAAVYIPAIILIAGEVRRLMRHYGTPYYQLYA